MFQSTQILGKFHLETLMSSAAVQTRLTPEEYITLERKAIIKSEYLSGERIVMPGASREHNLITMNIANQLYNQLLDRECEVYACDMRVRTHQPAFYTYPDVIVVCDEPQFEDDEFDTLLNPIIIVEVLSPSTEAYDRHEKFSLYKQLTSLQEYLLVSQDRVQVEQYYRQGTEWILDELHSLEDVSSLNSIDCQLSLHNIYRRVRFSKNQR